MSRIAPLALLAAAAMAAPALAQDATTPKFTGARVEGIAGWDRSQAYDNHRDGVEHVAAIFENLRFIFSHAP